MPLENPSEKSVQTREEMICPVCFNYSVREHASSDEYNSEKMKMYKASYCANPKCGKNLLSPDEVKQQYDEPSFISSLFSFSFSFTQIVQAGIVLGGILLLASLAFGISLPIPGLGGDTTPDETFELTGVVETSENLEELSVSAERTGDSASVSEDGIFTIELASADGDEIVIHGEEGYAIDRVPVEVDDESVTVTTDTDRYTAQDGELTVSRVELEEHEYSQIVQDSEVEYPLTTGDNAETIAVEVTPISEASSTQTINVLEESAITIPEGIISQETTVTVSPEEVESVEHGTFDGSSERFDIDGSGDISDVTLTIDRTAGENIESEEWVSTGQEQSVQVFEDATNVLLELESSETTIVDSHTGVSSNGQVEYSVPDITHGKSEVTVSSSITESTSTITGQITDSQISPEYSGSLDPSNITVEFTDAEVIDELISEDRVSANAESGNETSTVTLTESASEGTYRLDYMTGILESSNLTTVGYRINEGDVQEVSGDGSVGIEAEDGDLIELVAVAEQQEFETGSESMGSIQLDELEFQQTQLDPGDSTGVRAFVSNPSSSDESFTGVLYQDGEEITRQTTTVPGGADNYEILFDRISFDNEGVYGIGLNDTTPVAITVGDGELEYGSGYIEAELYQVEDEGEIAVDTDGDGSYDCVANPIGGSCEITTTSSISVDERNVSDTEYELSYTSRDGVSGVSVTSDSDSGYISGELDGSETVEVDVESGDTLSVNSGNASDFEYDIDIVEPEEVENPVVRVDGEVVAEPDSFAGSTTVDLGSLPSNQYTVQVDSESNSTIDVRMSWVEGDESVYPNASINGTEVCTGEAFTEDLSCSVDSSVLQQGMNTIDFSETQSEFDYTLTYNQSESVDTVRILENGEVVEVVEREDGAVGEWSTTVSDVFSVGSHTVGVDAGISNDAVSVETVLEFEDVPAENPRVVVTSGEGDENVFSVPDSSLEDGVLETRGVVEIPPESVSSGDNTLYFTSDNSGVYLVEFTVISDVPR